jgi:hypothetical protein
MQPIACNDGYTRRIKNLPMRVYCCYSQPTYPDDAMRHTAFFTFYFWFSHSSPTAVE